MQKRDLIERRISDIDSKFFDWLLINVFDVLPEVVDQYIMVMFEEEEFSQLEITRDHIDAMVPAEFRAQFLELFQSVNDYPAPDNVIILVENE